MDFPDDEIKNGIASLLKLESSQICFVYDWEINIDDKYLVYCERIMRKGGFPLQLIIYRAEKFIDISEFGRFCDEFCALMNCSVLISDEKLNPFSWILIDDQKNHYQAYLDIDKLNGEEEELEIKTFFRLK